MQVVSYVMPLTTCIGQIGIQLVCGIQHRKPMGDLGVLFNCYFGDPPSKAVHVIVQKVRFCILARSINKRYHFRCSLAFNLSVHPLLLGYWIHSHICLRSFLVFRIALALFSCLADAHN
jgi:hypothetical protein